MNPRILMLGCVWALALACSRSTGDSTAVAAKPAAAENAGWEVYEDDWVRAEHPPGSEVVGAKDGKQDPKRTALLIVPPPHAGKTVFGGVAIQADSKTQGMLLRDAIEAEVHGEVERRSFILSGPKELAVKNARCLGFMFTTAKDGCPQNEPACFHPTKLALCDAPDGRRFYILGILSGGTSPKALGPEAQREAAVYERILSSLEFKKS